jgi:hypothetical protein
MFSLSVSSFVLALLPIGLILNASSTAGVDHTSPDARGCPAAHAPSLPVRGHVYYGVQLNPKSGSPSPQSYARRLGRVPAIYGLYVSAPVTQPDQRSIIHYAHRIADLGAYMMIAVGPNGGLSTFTARSADHLASFLARVSAITPLFVRFGWEMNGSWYPWGQQPTAFIRAFREVSEAVHRDTDRASMVWAPNIGTGYPFPDETYSAQPGSPDFKLLDTNHNGQLDALDDPYAPYYPGNRYVDWVGLTLTYYGQRWPWTQNAVPEPGSFRAQLTGTYDGAGGDWRQVPDFYADYSVADHKPFMIAETSALYLPQLETGATDLQIKEGWWNQVFAADTPSTFPNLRAILWFEQDKYESNLQEYTSWAISYNRALLSAFRAALPRWLSWARPSGKPCRALR